MRFQYQALAATVLLAGAASSQAQIYKVTLNGANENPPVVTNGGGTAVITINTTTHELHVRSIFAGLNGNTTASHIHCCVAAPTGNAGVITATPSFAGFPTGVQSGTFDATYGTTISLAWNPAYVAANGGTAGAEASFVTGVASGGAYLNIHTLTSPGGEIRGTVQLFSFRAAANSLSSGAAYALDTLGAGTAALNERLVTMAMQGGGQQATSMQALLPAPGFVLGSLVSEGLFSSYDQIGDRLGGLRGDKNSGSGFWTRVAGQDGDLNLAARGATVQSDGWDVSVGFDTWVNATILWGGAFGYTERDYDFTGSMLGSSGSTMGWRATVYGEYLMGDVFFDGMATLAQHENELARFTGMALATSAPDVDQWGARLTAGIKLTLMPGASLTPQVRMDWSGVDIDGYTENSSDPLALKVNQQKQARMRLSVGGQADWEVTTSIKPFLRAFWGSENKDADVTTIANFVGGGSVFNVRDPGLDDSSYDVGIGVNLVGGDNFTASLSYDLNKSDDFENNTLQAKALWRF